MDAEGWAVNENVGSAYLLTSANSYTSFAGTILLTATMFHMPSWHTHTSEQIADTKHIHKYMTLVGAASTHYILTHCCALRWHAGRQSMEQAKEKWHALKIISQKRVSIPKIKSLSPSISHARAPAPKILPPSRHIFICFGVHFTCLLRTPWATYTYTHPTYLSNRLSHPLISVCPVQKS